MHETEVRLEPLSAVEAEPLIERVEELFVAHLVADNMAAVDEARRRAQEICARELSRVKSGRGAFFSIWKDQTSVGWLWVAERETPEPLTWHLLFIEIDRNHRGIGLGRKALEVLIQRAKDSNSTAITLNVSRQNSPAVRLYSRIGFHPYESGLILPLS